MKFANRIIQIGIIIAVSSLAIQTSECAHIVFLHHICGRSHLVATWDFAESLVSKGHNVTYLSGCPLPSNNPSISSVFPKRLTKFLQNTWDSELDVNSRLDGSLPKLYELTDMLNVVSCEMLLSSDELQSWLNTTLKVDLIYVDGIPECALGLAYKLNAKLAIMAVYQMLPRLFENFGIHFESSSIPSIDFPYKPPLSFIAKVKNTLIPLLSRFGQVNSWRTIENQIKTHLLLDFLPPMDELLKNISLIMTNGHFLEEQRRAFPPFVVSVPGLHVKESHSPLSKELEIFINSSSSTGEPSEGFIYISLGTVVRAPRLPQSVLKVFYNSFKAFPTIRFLWRWDGEFPTDIPDNLKLKKWFNQQDLLGHPKILGFITQAGRPSSQEALYNAVPTITFPIFTDQDYNANVLESLGVSINLEIALISEQKLIDSIRSILYDSKFKEKSKEMSQLYKDLPMNSIETAVWWTEYILRHKDTSHLKPLAIDQSWFERRLLDVWSFIIISFIVLIYIFYRLACIAARLISKFVKYIIVKNKLKLL